MQVILIADVKKVGQRGQLITVADGFALNVLIPQKKALPATAENLKKHEKGIAEAKQKADQSAAQAQALLAQIDGKTLTVEAKAGPTGTLFKSLHAQDIVSEIKKQWGIEIPSSALVLDHPIKQKGTYETAIELHKVLGKIHVSI
jgi:large subunit ribosomal protein L9